MFLTIQPLVNGVPTGQERKVLFRQGGILLQSDYEQIGHGDVRRSLANSALALSNDNIKFGLQISGSGWQKPGLDDVNFKGMVRLGWVEPFAQQTAGGAITPMRTARTDVDPFAYATTERGLVDTTLTDWTPAAVTGALFYTVNFYPLLDGYARYSGGFDQASRKYRWTLDFQEK